MAALQLPQRVPDIDRLPSARSPKRRPKPAFPTAAIAAGKRADLIRVRASRATFRW